MAIPDPEDGTAGSAPPAEPLAPTLPSDDASTAPDSGLAPPRGLGGSYRVEELIGQGGMGAVYRVTHRVLGKAFAAKVLPRMSHPERERRFLEEARIAGAIDHPNIVAVTDFGRDEAHLYLVMELLQGVSLDRRLAAHGGERSPLADEEARDIGRQVLRGLDAAHAAGVVHRDLKPSNVFLVRRHEGSEAKLLDFGVSTWAPDRRSDPRLTRTGHVVGTPLYMAPEQAAGEAGDARTDLYSFGVLAFELLTGEVPFPADTPYASIHQHAHAKVPSLAARRGDLPATLDAVVQRCLAKDPRDRFATAAEALEAWEAAWSAPSTTGIRAVTTPRPAPAPGRRAGRWTVLAALGVLGALGAVALAVGRAWTTDGAPPEEARLQPPASATPGPAASTEPATTVAEAVAPPGDQPPVGRRTLARYRDAVGPERRALQSPDVWRTAELDLASEVESGDSSAEARARWAFARGMRRFVEGGDDAAAQEAFEEAIEAQPEWALPYLGVSSAELRQGRVEAGLQHARQAERLEPDLWLTAAAVARAHLHADRPDRALLAYDRARASAPEEPVVIGGLALSHHALRNDAEARRLAERELALSPEAVLARLVLAEQTLEAGETERALELAEQALVFAPRHASLHLARADALAVLGRDQDARDAYARMLALVDEDGRRASGVPLARVRQVRRALARGRAPRIGPDRARSRALRRRPRTTRTRPNDEMIMDPW